MTEQDSFAKEAERALDMLFNPDNIDKLTIRRVLDAAQMDQLIVYVDEEPILLVLQEDQRIKLKQTIKVAEIH